MASTPPASTPPASPGGNAPGRPIERVIKRDGRQVPFDETKITVAIAKAMTAAGEPDDGFAGEVAGVVRLTLEDRHGGGPPPQIEEIQDLVEQALIELGRTAVAKAYILYRDQRARIRRALQVEEEAPRRGPLRVHVHESGGTASWKDWSKGRIVAALMREAELSREVAEKVAARVEERVFATGLTRLSTGLVRELVDNELVSLGLQSALRRQTSFGLPAYDLRRLLEEPPREPDPALPAPGEGLARGDVEGCVAGEVLRRFALQEVLGEELAERATAGDLRVHGLGRVHRPLWLAVPAAVLHGRSTPEGAFDLLCELARLARGAAHGVVLEDPSAALAPLVAGRGAGLGAWVRALLASATAAGRRIDLAAVGARSPALLGRLVLELAGLEDDALAPRLFVDEAELAALVDADVEGLDRLVLSGRLVPTWGADGTRLVAPGCHRAPGERAAITCAAAVSINLPRLALRAGPWREDRLLELSAEAAECAADILVRLTSLRRERPVVGRIATAVSPVGLREALAILGDGAVHPDQGARVLGLLGEAVERAGQRRRLSTCLTPFFGAGAAARFAELDVHLPQHRQRLLFDRDAGSGDEPGHAPGRPYGLGYRLAPRAGAPSPGADGGWAAEAALCATVPVGALHPLPAGPHDGVSAARAWLDFARRRAGPELPRPVPAPRPAGPVLFPDPQLHPSGTDA